MEETKKKIFLKNYLRPIIISLITTLLTFLLSYFIWMRQYLTTREEKIIDNKIALFKEFINITTKTMYYDYFIVRFELACSKLDYKVRDSINNLNSKQNFDSIENICQISIRKRVEESDPTLYNLKMKGLEFQNEFYSIISVCGIVFNDKVVSYLDTLSYKYSSDNIFKKIDSICEKRNINVTAIDESYFSDIIVLDMFKYYVKTVNEMYCEIKPE
jgi:hypothetical protein